MLGRKGLRPRLKCLPREGQEHAAHLEDVLCHFTLSRLRKPLWTTLGGRLQGAILAPIRERADCNSHNFGKPGSALARAHVQGPQFGQVGLRVARLRAKRTIARKCEKRHHKG